MSARGCDVCHKRGTACRCGAAPMTDDRWVYGGTPDAGRHPAVPEYRLEYRDWYWFVVDEQTNHDVSRHTLARDAAKEAVRLARERMETP
jgi:hypothetical protein